MTTGKQLFGTVAEAEAVLTEKREGGCAPSTGSPATFAKLEIAWPGFYLRFEATQHRISRVMEWMLKEALEAEAEFEASKVQSPKDQAAEL